MQPSATAHSRRCVTSHSKVRMRHILGVPYAHDLFSDSDLHAAVALAAAVAGFEPCQFRPALIALLGVAPADPASPWRRFHRS
jgi:hypothetical protein